MTHEEKARELVEFYIGDCSCEQDRKCVSCNLINDFTLTLASAEKKGREDERPKAFGSGFTSGWNEAVKACAKVAEEYCIGGLEDVCKSIANKIRGLMK